MGYGHDYRYSPAYLPDLAGQFSEKDFYAIKESGRPATISGSISSSRAA